MALMSNHRPLEIWKFATLLDTTSGTNTDRLFRLEQCMERCRDYEVAWRDTNRREISSIMLSLSSSILCELEWATYQIRPDRSEQASVVSTAEKAVGYLADAAEDGSIIGWCSPVFDRFSAVGLVLEEVSAEDRR